MRIRSWHPGGLASGWSSAGRTRRVGIRLMQSCRRPEVRSAVASLMMVALSDLAERDGAPQVCAMPDLRNWWRYGQESFVALRPSAWHMPERVAMVNWLDTFAE